MNFVRFFFFGFSEKIFKIIFIDNVLQIPMYKKVMLQNFCKKSFFCEIATRERIHNTTFYL
jgi:hypothetical protein